jgi:uncharacterized protein YqhQ
MPIYYWIMAGYTVLIAYILLILIWNLFDTNNFWEQVVAFFVIIPFLLRLVFIK